MKYNIEFTEKANQDIRIIYSWMKENAPHYADIWYSDLLKSINALHEFPLRFASMSDRDFPGLILRQMLVGKGKSIFKVIYFVVDSTVFILHIRHSSMDKMSSSDFDISHE